MLCWKCKKAKIHDPALGQMPMRYAVQRENKQTNFSPPKDCPLPRLFVYSPLPRLHSSLLRRVRISVIRRLRLLGRRSRVRVRVFGLARKQSRQLRRDHIVLSLGLGRSRWRWRRRRSLARSRRLAAGNCRSLRGRLLADYDCREGRWRLR